VAKTTSIPSYVLPLSKARIASARILSTTVVLERFGILDEMGSLLGAEHAMNVVEDVRAGHGGHPEYTTNPTIIL